MQRTKTMFGFMGDYIVIIMASLSYKLSNDIYLNYYIY